MPCSLIDIGANLAHDSFDEDRGGVIRRAADAGVTRIIVTGSHDESKVRAAELAKKRQDIACSTAGVHPAQPSAI